MDKSEYDRQIDDLEGSKGAFMQLSLHHVAYLDGNASASLVFAYILNLIRMKNLNHKDRKLLMKMNMWFTCKAGEIQKKMRMKPDKQRAAMRVLADAGLIEQQRRAGNVLWVRVISEKVKSISTTTRQYEENDELQENPVTKKLSNNEIRENPGTDTGKSRNLKLQGNPGSLSVLTIDSKKKTDKVSDPAGSSTDSSPSVLFEESLLPEHQRLKLPKPDKYRLLAEKYVRTAITIGTLIKKKDKTETSIKARSASWAELLRDIDVPIEELEPNLLKYLEYLRVKPRIPYMIRATKASTFAERYGDIKEWLQEQKNPRSQNGKPKQVQMRWVEVREQDPSDPTGKRFFLKSKQVPV